jgi:hypothetical protein
VTDRLTLKNERSTWYPASINNLEQHLVILIKENAYLNLAEVYPIRKNLAYSLQYIEFLNRVLNDISLSSVLHTQNIKSFVVHGAAIIEAIFNFLVIINGYGKTTNWKKIDSYSSPEFTIGGMQYKNETNIYEKISIPVPTKMTFDQLSKKIESKKLLGQSFPAYSKIKPIRQLRNKIHIHDSESSTDTDWNNFNQSQLLLVRKVLHSVLTSEVFYGSNHFDKFDYLKEANNGIQADAAEPRR